MIYLQYFELKSTMVVPPLTRLLNWLVDVGNCTLAVKIAGTNIMLKTKTNALLPIIFVFSVNVLLLFISIINLKYI